MMKKISNLLIVFFMVFTIFPCSNTDIYAEEINIKEQTVETADDENQISEAEHEQPKENTEADDSITTVIETASDSEEMVTDEENAVEIITEETVENTEETAPLESSPDEDISDAEPEETAEEEADQLDAPEITIYEVTLNGVKAPSTGAVCSTSGMNPASGSRFSITSKYWFDSESSKTMGESDKFSANTTYQLRMTLTPNDGYVFAEKENITVKFNGLTVKYPVDVTGSGSDKRRFLWIKFDAPDAVPVNHIRLDSINAPVAGATANYVPYKMSEHILPGNTMQWKCLEENKYIGKTEVFKNGRTYAFVIDVLPFDGHTMADPSKITAVWGGYAPNGYQVQISKTSPVQKNTLGAAGVTVTYIFPKIPAIPIKDVPLNFTNIPYVGNGIKPTSPVSVPDGSHYWISDIKWMSANGVMTYSDSYQPGETYDLHVTVHPDKSLMYELSAPSLLKTELIGLSSSRYQVFKEWSDIADNARLLRFRFIMPYFSDVLNKDDFFYKPVYWSASEEIVSGWDDGTFRPWNECNRAAMITFLWRLNGSPLTYANTKSPFSDVDGNNQFYPAIMWGYKTGLIKGYDDGTFRPWASCNRAAIIAFLWRDAGSPMTYANEKSPFSDVDGTNQFYPAIMWGYKTGIIQGYSDGTFRPWATCNRAAAVSFIYRYSN